MIYIDQIAPTKTGQLPFFISALVQCFPLGFTSLRNRGQMCKIVYHMGFTLNIEGEIPKH